MRSVRAKKGSHIDARSELRPTTNWRTTGVDLAPPLVYWRDSHVDVAIDNFLSWIVPPPSADLNQHTPWNNIANNALRSHNTNCGSPRESTLPSDSHLVPHNGAATLSSTNQRIKWYPYMQVQLWMPPITPIPLETSIEHGLSHKNGSKSASANNKEAKCYQPNVRAAAVV